MKTKMFKSALSLMLVLLLCVSVVAPAISAADTDATAVAADGVVLEKHAGNPTVAKSDLQTLFGDGTGITNTAFYGYAPVPEADTDLDINTIVNVTGTTAIMEGNWLALKTTAYTGSLFSRKADWTDATKRSQLSFSVRTYYTAEFTVSGSVDGALYLNGEAVDGSVNLFTDSEYVVTAADVEGFSREVTGVTLDETFTPSSDLTVTAVYTADASAAIELTVSDGGTAKIMSDGAEVTTDTIPAGKTFTVETTPNTTKGYRLESIVVTKDGEETEAVEGVYGPVADGEIYAVAVTFVYDPVRVEIEVPANDAQVSRSDLNGFFNGAYSYYGIAPADDPDNISYLAVALTSDYDVEDGAEYIIYGSSEGNILSPKWTNAALMVLSVKEYYNASFTVTGHEEGEVYLNGEAVTGTVKIYPGEEYTVTAKNIDDYIYEINGAEDGVAFTPSSNINVTVTYMKEAYATFTVNANEGGTVTVRSNGDAVTERVSEGDFFTVEAVPNANKGYELESIVVTKEGEEVEAVDGAYGPVSDGEEYVLTVTFNYNPPRVDKEVDANEGDVSRSDLNSLFGGAYSYYGIAPVSDPENITYLAVALTSDYDVADGGEYCIYGSNDGNILSPKWTNAKLMIMTVRTYYNASFTVTGHEEGEVYLNGEAIVGSTKLYVDTEYTVTVKAIDEYTYTMNGAEDGAAFTPSSDVNVTVAYLKLAYATFTLTAGDGGTAEVKVNGEAVTERISEGESFTVAATPNANRGYKLDSIVVTKEGEEVEAVEGAYGPVADGEEYVITVTFKYDPPRVDLDVDANEGDVSRSDLNTLFGGAYNYYGIADPSAPDDITYLAVALTSDYDVEDGGEYIIYGTNDGNILSPKWTNAKLMVMTVRTYYNGTFTVNAPADMPEDGAVYLNDESVQGSVKLYTDETYTVTVKAIDEYICTLHGAEDGVEFTPAEDIDVTAVYMKETYATITVIANEGGTVEVKSGDDIVFDKLPEGESFEVTVTADANNAYYVENFVVTKDGDEIEEVDGVYGPVADGESYEIYVTFSQATLAFDGCEVTLIDIKDQKFDEIEQAILAGTTLLPATFAENAQTKVEYAAYSLLGYDIYEPLNYTGALSHAFGTSSLGGELLDGNTEKVRVTYTLPDYGIELQAIATVTVRDIREATSVEGGTITITYGDDLKAAVMDVIAVYDSANEPIEFTEEDITIDPETLNANLLSAYRAQDVTVRYNGSDYYAISEGTVSVYVNRAQSSLDAKSEIITYGETPAAEVITTPENLDVVKVIAGIDGEAQGFVSIDIPNSVKEKMQIKVGGIVLLDIYQILSDRIGEGSTIDDLKNLVLDIYNNITSNDMIKQAIENSGFNMEILDSIIGFIEELPDSGSTLKIRLGQVPKNAGAYLMFAVSTDTNYTTSADLSYILIKPQTENEEGAFELRFRSEIENEMNVLTYEEAQEFEFGGDFYKGDVLTETDKIHTLYVGTTFSGEVISQSEPVTEPGVYTETVYILGGNEWATPIFRAFIISRMESELLMDDLTVTYDGEAHALEAYMDNDEIDLTDKVTYTYYGNGYLSTEAPVNAGEYTVYAFYSGDDMNQPTSVSAVLTIEKLPATITVTCTEELTYGDVNIFNVSEAANIQYSVSGTINDDVLGAIIPTLSGETVLTVGEYTASVLFIQTNSNYDVTIENAVLKIVPREVTVTVDDKQKFYGTEDPELTYQIDNMMFFDKAVVSVTREEGDDVGEYNITAEVQENPNYIFNVVDGTFTIIPNDITVKITDAEKTYGDDDPAFTYEITDADGQPYEDEDIVVNFTREEGDDVGEYTISADVEAPGCNVTVVDGTLTISPKVITITVDDAEKAYGDDDPEFTYTITDADGQPYENEGLVVTVIREEGDSIGTYAITASINDTTNYTLSTEPAVFTITAKKIIVNIDDKEKTVNTIDPVFTYTVTDSKGDSVDPRSIGLVIAREVGEEVGEYEIFAARINNTNYVLDAENCTVGTLTIKEVVHDTYLLGDADGDGVVTVLDITYIQRKTAYSPGIDHFDALAADVDFDGSITILDATWIQRYLAYMPKESIPYPIGEYIPLP